MCENPTQRQLATSLKIQSAILRVTERVRDTRASSLVEFAVSLPLLVVLVMGIIDFGGAFNLKQELNNAMREGARFGSAQPTNDLCSSCAPPGSVNAIAYLVDAYLTAAKINDCGLAAAINSATGLGPPWIYTASTGCPGTLTLTVYRDPTLGGTGNAALCGVPAVNYGGVGGLTVYMPCTRVQIKYPYQWHFNNVIQLISPGTSFALSTIQTDATAVNMQ